MIEVRGITKKYGKKNVVDNVSLIRRKIKNSDLKFEPIYVGNRSQTVVCISCIKGIAPDYLIEHVKEIVNKLDLKFILDTNYIDIMLVHQPLGDYYGSWRAMEELYDQNVLRGLGLSNFYEDRLIDLLYHCNVKPVVNQIECHPFNQRQALIQLMRKHQVVGMAWSPFTRDRQPVFDHPIIKSLAEKYGVTKHQIILRWHIQRGIIPLPKANNVSHMEANFNVFDFKLTNIDMDVMELLDQQDFLEDHHTALGLERLLQLK